MTSRVILAGNSVTASILYDYLLDDACYEVVGSVVDDECVDRSTLGEVKCCAVADVSTAFRPTDVSVILAAGYSGLNEPRENLAARLLSLGYRIDRYVHPDAHIYSRIELGAGAVVLPGAVIEPHARVGANVMVWCNATIGHHSVIEDNCWIASDAVISGFARVSQNSFVGVNATITNEVTVGPRNIIGAGALVSKNTRASTVHLARNAEPLRFTSEEYAKVFLK